MPTVEVSSTKVTYFDPTIVVNDRVSGQVSVGVKRKFLAEVQEGKTMERTESTQWLHWDDKKFKWKTEVIPTSGAFEPPWLATFPNDVWDSLQIFLLSLVKGA